MLCMVGIIFIATAWGRNNGGINSINTALLKELCNVIPPEQDWKLFCIVTERGEDADEVDRIQEQYNITLIKTKNPVTSNRLKKELSQPNFSQLFFVGHDIITGDYANQLRDRYAQKKAVSIVFHHMDYSKYYYLREKNPEKIREKEKQQRRVLPSADIIIPIGPFLTESAQDLCTDARKNGKIKIHEIIPGMENIEPIQGVHHSHKVILFGRLEDRNNAVKQIELAIDAIGNYVAMNDAKDLIIRCYGYADDSAVNQKNLMNEICQAAGKVIPITANSYISEEKELFEQLASASLCIMPSTYEGFGLTAYEAIAAGVPVIISKQTGLFKFLNSWKGEPIHALFKSIDVHGGMQENGKEYAEDDLHALSECIREVFSDYTKHKEMALELREILLNGGCTWNYAARAFVSVITEEIKDETPLPAIENIQHANTKRILELSQYIQNALIPEFCAPFCDINKLICKVIKYSNDRKRRFTIFSSDEVNQISDNRLRVRAINNGTVGILNSVFGKKGLPDFPIIISNFTCGRCTLVSGISKIEDLENVNIGVPDHQVLAIIAVPIVYQNSLVGALTVDIFDLNFIKRLEDDASVVMNLMYSNLHHFSSILTTQFYTDIKDDLNFSEVHKMITQREFVSFSGKCPLNCKHCFASEIVDENTSVLDTKDDIQAIIKELSKKQFDVVYVSHYKENFYEADAGVDLCEEIYDHYKCDICVTTRCAFSGKPLFRIRELSRKMASKGNSLSFCISIPALESYRKIENAELIATPTQRIDFAGQLKAIGINTFVSIRPLFPASFISTNEIHRLVDQCGDKIDGILTGGLYATDNILKNLQIPRETLTFCNEADSEYLLGIEKTFHAVDVENEIRDLEAYCKSKSILFFRHSMEALNYFKI